MAYLCDGNEIHIGEVCIRQAIMPHTARQALLQNGILGIQGLMLCTELLRVTRLTVSQASQASRFMEWRPSSYQFAQAGRPPCLVRITQGSRDECACVRWCLTARPSAVGLEPCGLDVCKGGIQRATGAGLPRAAWAADGPNRPHCIHADVREAQKDVALLAAALNIAAQALEDF